MSYSPKKQHYFVLFFATFILVCVATIELLHQSQNKLRQERTQVKTKEQLSLLGASLEASLMADIYKVSTLAATITLLPTHDYHELNRIVNHILDKSRHIISIGIAENEVLRRAYPRQGNESAVAEHSRILEEKAREIEDIVVAGPVSLKEGDLILTVQVPVFFDPPINKNYWGSIRATIDLKALFQDIGVLNFSYLYPLTIRGYDNLGQYGDVFFGDHNESKQVYGRERVHFPNGGWLMAVHSNGESDNQVPWYIFNLARIVGYSILLVLICAMIVIYRLYSIADSRALHDELTKLPNRRYFMQSYKQQFEIAQRYKKRYSFALINIDLDKFKHINDTFGHDAGDKVLIACAQRVKRTLRRSDIVARVGGDEFLVLVHNPETEENIRALLNKLRKALCSTPVKYDGQQIYFRASLGYAVFDSEIESPEMMMKIADDWMYRQKRRVAGRDK
ncbi:sensor domain-containing diguanylate cyclase [Vibrio sp. PNB23_22_6]|uniref:diguanylate cyclase n=1 Tax=Vibrio TaxID=662 RepID=UPI000BFFED10|nr:diguanylate cyclase [Vibrio sp. PID17_43]PHJ43095.1 diguanylate cyclase [Vibrio sp. PID17_43]